MTPEQMDLYFALRLAFVGRPNCRISTEDRGYEIVAYFEEWYNGVQLRGKLAFSAQSFFGMLSFLGAAARARRDFDLEREKAGEWRPRGPMFGAHRCAFLGGKAHGTRMMIPDPPSYFTLDASPEPDYILPYAHESAPKEMPFRTEIYQLGTYRGEPTYRLNGSIG